MKRARRGCDRPIASWATCGSAPCTHSHQGAGFLREFVHTSPLLTRQFDPPCCMLPAARCTRRYLAHPGRHRALAANAAAFPTRPAPAAMQQACIRAPSCHHLGVSHSPTPAGLAAIVPARNSSNSNNSRAMLPSCSSSSCMAATSIDIISRSNRSISRRRSAATGRRRMCCCTPEDQAGGLPLPWGAAVAAAGVS